MRPLKVNPEYRAMVPRPCPEDYEALEADIVAKGEATEPIVVNQDDVILDGHTRYEICCKNGCFYTTRTVEFDDPVDERLYVITTNLYRRHMNDYQRVEMAKPLEKLYAEKAQRNMEGGTLVSNEKRVDTAAEVSKIIGVKKGTYVRAKKIRDSKDVLLQERVRAGEISISRAYNRLTPPEPEEPKPIPKVVVGDVVDRLKAPGVLSKLDESVQTLYDAYKEDLKVLRRVLSRTGGG